MNTNSSKAIYLEYFRTEELLRCITHILPYALRPDTKSYYTGPPEDDLLKSIKNQAIELDIDQKLFNQFLRDTIDGLKAGNSPKAASNCVGSYLERLQPAINKIPNTLDKAYDALRALVEVESYKAYPTADQTYDAMVLLREEISTELIARVVRNWKKEASIHMAEYKRDLDSEIFWVSLDYHESIDNISRYRFREYFDFSEFESAFSEVESMFAEELAQGCGGTGVPIYGGDALTPVAYDLWLASRSRNLPNSIRDSVNIALRNIGTIQSPEGWWTDCRIHLSDDERSLTDSRISQYLPKTYTTALCSLDLLKLSRPEPFKEKGAIGAKWLIERQNPNGSWSREIVVKDRLESRQDIFLTLLALEALLRSGIGNIKHTIDLGIDWIMKQQNAFGMWDDEGFPYPFMTVCILEFMKLKDSLKSELSPYESIARGFLERSIQMSLEENANSHRLAIISAHHGIEAFLYSLLVHSSVNEKIFETANKTIGFRKALTKFQTYLQDKGMISSQENILFRNSLDRLAYLRDEVVHKGLDITQAECSNLVNDAVRFTSLYSIKILGYDIFL